MSEIEILRMPPFPSRQLVIAAANLLKAEGHSGFDALRLEFDLLDTGAGTGGGLAARATSLATYALQNPEARTPEGHGLMSAIVARAGDIYRSSNRANIGEKELAAFKNASASAGELNDVTESGTTILVAPGFEVPTSGAGDVPVESAKPPPGPRPRKVFIVHGHDEGAREGVARFLERLGFEAVILHERANRGDTLMEKFEANGDVGFAIVLLTPDDTGGRVGTVSQARARQNVIFEWGYFVARLGRRHVIALRKGDVELPSDLHGIVWEDLDSGGAWKTKLARELAAAGYDIDWEAAAG